MNNLFYYTDYINEGLFRSSKNYDIYKKLEKICNEIDPKAIKVNYKSITFFYKVSNSNPINDPYGEEFYENEDIKIEVKRFLTLSITRNYDYKVYINGDLIELGNYKAKGLYKILENKANNQKKIEKEERVRKTLEKI